MNRVLATNKAIIRISCLKDNYGSSSNSDYLSNLTLTYDTSTLKVGTIIRAMTTPEDAEVSYQWFSGNTLIEAATEDSLLVVEDYINTKISCIATADYGDFTLNQSAETDIVPSNTAGDDFIDSIALSTRYPVVGDVIHVTVRPVGAARSFEWTCNGSLIGGQPSVEVIEEYAGYVLTCTVYDSYGLDYSVSTNSVALA